MPAQKGSGQLRMLHAKDDVGFCSDAQNPFDRLKTACIFRHGIDHPAHGINCLQFWTALFWVTTVDLLVRHFGMVVKVCLECYHGLSLSHVRHVCLCLPVMLRC